MLTRENNELICRVGAHTRAGHQAAWVNRRDLLKRRPRGASRNRKPDSAFVVISISAFSPRDRR
jgi:hypothetical protein